MKIRIGLLGATGYTGAELLRLLINHSKVDIVWITSEKFTNEKIADVFPHLNTFLDLECRSAKDTRYFEMVDLVFSCLPHGTSMHFADLFLNKGVKFIDLSADFRFNNEDEYYKIYKIRHNHPEIIKKSIYGLTELYRGKIKNAQLIANPGCFATGAILGLAPLIENNIINAEFINIDCKSGLSGAGRSPALERQFSEANNSVSVNTITYHNQKPEIEEILHDLYEVRPGLVFTSYDINIERGILSTITAKMKTSVPESKLLKIYHQFYADNYFIRVLDEAKNISTKNLRFTNFCDIGLSIQNDNIICVTAIDNLGKGACGQAVQNMNIMFGLNETESLNNPSLFP